MPRILSVSSSRSDVGILLPVWRELVAQAACELHILMTGMHAAGVTALDMPQGAQVHCGGADLGGGTPETAAAAMASILSFAGRLYSEVKPDTVLVVGDRLDMMPAAIATVPFNLPLAHLHGGEITEGAVDDRLRHAMTKLAHMHFVSCEGARQRLLALGEEDCRIHVTGAPGLDTLFAAPAIGRGEFLRLLGFPADTADLRLVTVHPETNSPDPAAPLAAVLDALASRAGPTLFTAPNSDPGGARMRADIEAFVAGHAFSRFRETLGPELYSNALRHARVMIGNSSSGVIEAGLFGLPVIDIGERQRGRDRGNNVVNVPNESASVRAALDQVLARPGRCAVNSLYGDGQSGPRVARLLVEQPVRNRLLRKSHSAAAC